MDTVRLGKVLGKVLGKGVRQAARTAMDAAEAVAASDPQAASTVQNRRQAQRTRAVQPMKTSLQSAKKAGHTLWLEMTASFFLLFALPFVAMCVRLRAGWRVENPEHARFLMCAGLAILFGYFSVTGFLRAWRRR